MIQIDKATMDKLQCYAGQNALIEKLCGQNADIDPSDILNYSQLRKDLVEEFLPLIQTLVNAGLVSVGIDDTGEKFSGFVGGQAVRVFENGNINVWASSLDSCGDKQVLS